MQKYKEIKYLLPNLTNNIGPFVSVKSSVFLLEQKTSQPQLASFSCSAVVAYECCFSVFYFFQSRNGDLKKCLRSA